MKTCRWIFAITLLAVVGIGQASVSHAQVNDVPDRILLKSGGELVGTIKSESQEDGKNFIEFETEAGGVLKLNKSRLVRKIIPADGLATEYMQRSAAAQTPEQHWEMIAWCEEQPEGRSRFRNEVKFHLKQIVAADPNDTKAWQKLGYRRRDRDGDWIRREEMFAVSGYTNVTGEWVSKQLLGVGQQLEQADQERRDGGTAFQTWKKSLRKIDAFTARANLISIMKPSVVAPLYEFARENRDPSLRRLAVEAIATVDSNVSMSALVNFAIQDPAISVRQAAATLLENEPHFAPERVAGMVVAGGYLQHEQNAFVENAGRLLGQVQSDAAILPLIHALQTTHKVATGEGQGRTRVSSVGGEIQGLDTGGGPAFVDTVSSNQSVAGALRAITGGQEFGFNESAALAWYIENYGYPEMDLRGDN